MSLRRRFKSNDDAAVDMTPMLDIVFIMLIFFIVTATFLNESGLNLSHAQDQGDPPCAHRDCPVPIEIYISESDEISVDGNVTGLMGVENAVQSLLAHNPNAHIILTSHEYSTLEPLTQIKSRMEVMGLKTTLKMSYAQ